MLYNLILPVLSAGAGLDENIQQAVATLENTDPAILLSRAKTALLDFLPRFFGALIFLIAAFALIKSIVGLVGKLLKRSKIDPTLHRFILGLFKNSMWVIVIITVLLILRFPASPLITLIGSVGLALSLALKDSLANMAGGVSILFNHPFSKGDFIEVKGVTGTVKAIDLVYTIITGENGDTVYLPNGDVAKSVVINYKTKPEKQNEDIANI